jgi:hypothetical protein
MAIKKHANKSLTEPVIRQFEVVVMAVSDLGGAARSIDTEDVAIRCQELAPDLFAWRKYPAQVNLELVRVCLSNAKKQPNGTLLSGSGRDGWRLTRKGLEWVSTRGQAQAPSQVTPSRRTAGSIDTVRRVREMARIESSAAWQTWRANNRIDELDARALFRIDSYATNRLIEIKVTRLLALFGAGTDHRGFLEAAASALKVNRTDDA